MDLWTWEFIFIPRFQSWNHKRWCQFVQSMHLALEGMDFLGRAACPGRRTRPFPCLGLGVLLHFIPIFISLRIDTVSWAFQSPPKLEHWVEHAIKKGTCCSGDSAVTRMDQFWMKFELIRALSLSLPGRLSALSQPRPSSRGQKSTGSHRRHPKASKGEGETSGDRVWQWHIMALFWESQLAFLAL
jgi:hypothetical protein